MKPENARPPAANDNTRARWVALPAEAERRGLSTEGLRRWCERRGVKIHQANHRDAWVQPDAIDAAIEALPVALRVRAGARDEIDEALSHVPGVRR